MLHVHVQEFERQVSKEMQQVTEYFGENYDATDPAKVLRVIRDFMTLFDKSIFEIKVGSQLTPAYMLGARDEHGDSSRACG